jgi:hypothetical protein
MSEGGTTICPLCKGAFAQGVQHVCVFPGIPGFPGAAPDPLPPAPNWQFGPQWHNPFGMPMPPFSPVRLLTRRDEMAIEIIRILIESSVRCGYGVHANGSWEQMAKEAYVAAGAMIKESENPACPTQDPSLADSLIK